MPAISGWSLYSANVDPRYVTNSRLRDSIEALRSADTAPASSARQDPAYILDISDTARARAAGNGAGTAFSASSLFTQAGRKEAAERYDQVYENLLAAYGEDEARERFDEFMRSEGFASAAAGSQSMTAPCGPAGQGGSGLTTSSYLKADVIDGKEMILAATWASYSIGGTTYQKKIADSFDIAADSTNILKGGNVYSTIMMGHEAYTSQTAGLMGRVDQLLEEALSTGRLIGSTVTEEQMNQAMANDSDRYRNTTWGVLTETGREAMPAESPAGSRPASGPSAAVEESIAKLSRNSTVSPAARQNTQAQQKQGLFDFLRKFRQ